MYCWQLAEEVTQLNFIVWPSVVQSRFSLSFSLSLFRTPFSLSLSHLSLLLLYSVTFTALQAPKNSQSDFPQQVAGDSSLNLGQT